MGNPLKRRAVNAMLTRWERDLARLEELFGDYAADDFSEDAEMQRNLGTAAQYAKAFLNRATTVHTTKR